MALSDEHCVAIQCGEAPLSEAKARELAADIPRWTLREQSLTREYTCQDFRAAIAFVNRLADLAEEQQHHPDIRISYNTVTLDLSTHKIHGLSRNDFILAAKIDLLSA